MRREEKTAKKQNLQTTLHAKELNSLYVVNKQTNIQWI